MLYRIIFRTLYIVFYRQLLQAQRKKTPEIYNSDRFHDKLYLYLM